MEILKRGSLTFYIKEEAVIVGINDFQFIAYTVYALQNRKPFYDFKQAILRSKENEYNTVVKGMNLGRKYGLKAVSSRKPKEKVEIKNENNIPR
jgi:hypothetical protein